MNQESKEVVDFIGVGAQKAGTTWLNERLDELPDISVPPIKEIHYFDRSTEYPSPNTHASDSLFGKLKTKNWYIRFYRKLILPLLGGDTKNIRWKLFYFFKKPTDDWYRSLFKNLEGISGEITPSYSFLSIHDLKHIKRLFPNIKIILLLRDPIDRAWSHYRYVHKMEAYGDTKEIYRFMNSKEQLKRSDYLTILKNYRSVFDENQLYISFYDRVVEDPEGLLSEIVSFIGGNPKNIATYCSINAQSNVSKQGNIPDEALAILKSKYKTTIEKMAHEFNSFPEKWRIKYYQ